MKKQKVGELFDESFGRLDPETIIHNLDGFCYEKTERNYSKILTDEELTQKKNELSEISIKIADLEAERKRLMDEYKSKLEQPKLELNVLIDTVKHKTEYVFGTNWLVDDQESKTMYFLDEKGIIVEKRPLFNKERQTKLKSIKSQSNE